MSGRVSLTSGLEAEWIMGRGQSAGPVGGQPLNTGEIMCSRLYSKPAQRCCNFPPVHCSGAKFWNSVNHCKSAPEQNHCSRANFWNGVISECCNSVALHCSGAKLHSWRPNFLEWCQQLQTALEQNNCSGVKFRNSVSDFCSGALHCNCTATPVQHLCAGLEYSLVCIFIL